MAADTAPSTGKGTSSGTGTSTTNGGPPAAPGGLAQIHGSGGGYAIGSYVLNMQQLMASAGSSAANLWGIADGSNLVQCFSNGGVDQTSPFGNAILTQLADRLREKRTDLRSLRSLGFHAGAPRVRLAFFPRSCE